MPNTVNRGYPYPANGDRATVPADMQEPLEWIDADVQNILDEQAERVRGVGADTLWVGTYAEYDLIDPKDPDTVYIIRGGERSNPGKTWGLGVPTVTLPSPTGVNSLSVPALPPLVDEWGYLVFIIGINPVPATSWSPAPGWTRLADQADVSSGSVRPMGVFKAPAGTPTGIFNLPGHGQGRHIALAFPVMLEPTNEGFVQGTSSGSTLTIPNQAFVNPAVPIMIAATHYTSMAVTAVPKMQDAQYNTPNPATLTIGQGASVLHLHIGTRALSFAAGRTYSLTATPNGTVGVWRIGVGTQ